MPDAPTPEMLKKMKLDSESSAPGPSSTTTDHSTSNGTSKSGPRRAYVLDEDEEEAQAEARAAADFAPGGDAYYFVEEDEEGRFFGGGLTSEQKEILNIFDKDVAEGAVEDVSSHYASGDDSIDINIDRRNECYRCQKVTATV